MGFLAPLLLALGLAVAIPLVLHLFQRHQGPRVVFPALRYLRRAEREHARRIRLRQLLLLALRVCIVLLLALAAARPFLRRGGAAHEPTAVVLILDNSLSSGLIQQDRRMLDMLKERALETLARARAEDRFWLLRAGAPWEPVLPGDAQTLAARVRETEVMASAADLSRALERAQTVLAGSGAARAREIQLLSDLQANAFAGAIAGPADAPALVVWAPGAATPANAALVAVEVGGGLAPRAGERSTVSVEVSGAVRDSVTVRLTVDGRVQGAGVARPGTVALLPFPARPAGIYTGWVEKDPDALRGDDRRYFAVHVTPPPAVTITRPLPFVAEALAVLADAGRIRPAGSAAADVVLAPAADGVSATRAGRAVVATPPSTPLELPGTNRRLAAAGIPWRYALMPATGEARFAPPAAGDELLTALEETRILQWYRLEPAGAGAAADSVLLRLRDGAAWALRGRTGEGGRYVLIGSPLTPDASTLPTSAAMLPLLDRLVGAWVAEEATRMAASPGDVLALAAGATAVERPDGEREPVSAPGEYRVPGKPGIYKILANDAVAAAFTVNPPAAESDLARLAPRRLRALLPGWKVRTAKDADEWLASIYRQRHGREVWRTLVLLALAALLVEALVAAAGPARRRAATPAEPEPVTEAPPARAASPRPRVPASGEAAKEG